MKLMPCLRVSRSDAVSASASRQFGEFGMARESVVVNRHFAVNRHQIAVAVDDQWVDLGQ